MKRICKNCDHYDIMRPNSDTGWCVRYAPRLLLTEHWQCLGTTVGFRYKSVERVSADWPVVFEDNRCGEWKENLALTKNQDIEE